ncbi:MAG TPA: OmpA family protein [Bryobacteraceae bacterium]|jgi:peptidoglycan-associated lipoprotein|nr:OmpA family protein [Bryobacteraceae bacterium]
MRNRKAALGLIAGTMLIFAAGCHHKTPPPPPPPPPPTTTAPAPAGAPTINYFNAEPTLLNAGQPSTLRWSVSGATDISIDNGIGQVSPNGRRAVYPTATTTYTLTASAAGGTPATGTATVTISAPPPPTAIERPPTQSSAEALASQVQDLHFDYDKSDIRPEDQTLLVADANALKTILASDPNFIVTIEGHCDERGSAEYNIGLGDRRASATKEALVSMGVAGDKLKTVSYGKERPLCTDADEACYARNRRAHFSPGQ